MAALLKDWGKKWYPIVGSSKEYFNNPQHPEIIDDFCACFGYTGVYTPDSTCHFWIRSDGAEIAWDYTEGSTTRTIYFTIPEGLTTDSLSFWSWELIGDTTIKYTRTTTGYVFSTEVPSTYVKSGSNARRSQFFAAKNFKYYSTPTSTLNSTGFKNILRAAFNNSDIEVTFEGMDSIELVADSDNQVLIWSRNDNNPNKKIVIDFPFSCVAGCDLYCCYAGTSWRTYDKIVSPVAINNGQTVRYIFSNECWNSEYNRCNVSFTQWSWTFNSLLSRSFSNSANYFAFSEEVIDTIPLLDSQENFNNWCATLPNISGGFFLENTTQATFIFEYRDDEDPSYPQSIYDTAYIMCFIADKPGTILKFSNGSNKNFYYSTYADTNIIICGLSPDYDSIHIPVKKINTAIDTRDLYQWNNKPLLKNTYLELTENNIEDISSTSGDVQYGSTYLSEIGCYGLTAKSFKILTTPCLAKEQQSINYNFNTAQNYGDSTYTSKKFHVFATTHKEGKYELVWDNFNKTSSTYDSPTITIDSSTNTFKINGPNITVKMKKGDQIILISDHNGNPGTMSISGVPSVCSGIDINTLRNRSYQIYTGQCSNGCVKEGTWSGANVRYRAPFSCALMFLNGNRITATYSQPRAFYYTNYTTGETGIVNSDTFGGILTQQYIYEHTVTLKDSGYWETSYSLGDNNGANLSPTTYQAGYSLSDCQVTIKIPYYSLQGITLPQNTSELIATTYDERLSASQKSATGAAWFQCKKANRRLCNFGTGGFNPIYYQYNYNGYYALSYVHIANSSTWSERVAVYIYHPQND